MKPRILSLSLLLFFVVAMIASPSLAMPPDATAGQDRLEEMIRDGWVLVVPGVLQRSKGDHKVETLALGPEGFAWMAKQLQARLEFLLEESRVRPTANLGKIIRGQRQQIRKLQQYIQLLERSKSDSAETAAVTGCNESYAAHANAHLPVSTPGVRAEADASFSNSCGYSGDTYAFAYAKATLNGTTTTQNQDDPDTGSNISSFAAASAAGTTDCYSQAYASVTSVDLGISYSKADENYACQTAAAPNKIRIEDVPAATLLLPYFEVNLGDPNGMTTLVSINNASALAVLAHVVVWSDLSVPVLDFNVYLTGYDVHTINLRDIFVNGVLPRTASAGQDPNDTISPQGDFSQDINFESCNGQLPPPNLPASFIQHLQLSLTGQSSPVLGNRCAGRALGDNIARGYITVDTVNNCTLRFPGDPGYFASGGTGDATNQNILWGDYFYGNPGENFAQGETLVHIEADATNPEFSRPGNYTFYGRYVNWTAADNRKPLATNFAVRYINGGAFSGGTSLAVWRDSKVNQAPFTCPAVAGSLPPWFPLGQEGIVIFDEQENPDVPQSFPSSPAPVATFPAEAQRTRVGGASFPVPFNFGWLLLNLNTRVAAAGNNPPEDPTAAQAWVTAIIESHGRFSVGFDAIQLDSASSANHSIAPRTP